MRPSFLYASTIPLFRGIGLSVYRSLALPHHDGWYAPVRGFLKQNKHDLLRSVIVADDTMMFGEAEHSIYAIKGKTWK